MKKILSVSVVALLAMAPTMGWAANVVPATAHGQNVQNYQATMPTMNAGGNTRDNSYGYNKGKSDTAGNRNLVDPNGPIYNGVDVEAVDGQHAAAVSFVKGAYNDLIEKINGVEVQPQVATTWGDDSSYENAVRPVVVPNP